MAFKRSAFRGAAFAFVLAGGLGACATQPEDEQAAGDDLFGAAAEVEDNDPIEPFNRAVFDINVGLDRILLKPVATLYRDALPEAVRDSVRNFLDNFSAPVTLINSLLQGDFDNAWTTLVRFGINSTAGVAGFFDFAEDWGYPEREEDFGQTLGVWGVGEGGYLVLPLFGPSSPRDAVGRAVDRFLNPIDWYVSGAPYAGIDGIAPPAGLAGAIASGIDERSRNIETLDALEKNSLDFYATVRSLYRQRREDLIANGEVTEFAEPGASLGEEPKP